MKKLFILLCCSIATMTYAQDQAPSRPTIQDSHHNILGYVDAGTIVDASGNTIIKYKTENGQQTVLDKAGNVLGHVARWEEITNAKNELLGTVMPGTTIISIVDKNKKTIGFATSAGEIQDANHIVIGYDKGTEPVWGAAYFFFFKN